MTGLGLAKIGVTATSGSKVQHQAYPHITATEAICTIGIMCVPGGSTDHHSGGGAVSVFSHSSMTPPCEMQKGASMDRGVGTLYRACPYWTTSGAKDTTRRDFPEKRPRRHLINGYPASSQEDGNAASEGNRMMDSCASCTQNSPPREVYPKVASFPLIV